jgi:hypothetical protein
LADPAEPPGVPERPVLRRAIRHRLRSLDPTLRVIAEDFMAEATRIDLLAVGVEGELVSIRIGEADEGSGVLVRALSDLGWLQPRIADWIKLAPGLGLDPSADVRCMILCPDFDAETRSASEHFPTRHLELFRYRWSRERAPLDVWLEPVASRPAMPATTGPEARETTSLDAAEAPGAETEPRGRPRLTAPPSDTSFRTGLTDADLELEPRPRNAV